MCVVSDQLDLGLNSVFGFFFQIETQLYIAQTVIRTNEHNV